MQGRVHYRRLWKDTTDVFAGLQCVRDNLLAQLLELGKSMPRGKESKVLIAEISRLESALHVVRDDQVRARPLVVIG